MHAKQKFGNSCWQLQFGVYERHKNVLRIHLCTCDEAFLRQLEFSIGLTSTVCGPVSGQVQFPATFRKSLFLVKKNEFQWETTLSKHSSMSLLSLSRLAAFKLWSKAEILSLREGR